MKATPFTFKKTKRVKRVTEYQALSLDLTREEVMALHIALNRVGASSGPLVAAIRTEINRFLVNHHAHDAVKVVES